MAFFTRKELRASGFARQLMEVAKSAEDLILKEASEASNSSRFDIFLSYRHLDAVEVLGLGEKFERMGYSVYIDDVKDKYLRDAPTSKSTAETVRKRMKQSKCLFFGTSKNHSDSKWMPWELGYFDGLKGKVAICPVSEDAEEVDFEGQEYLGLYPYISREPSEKTGKEVLWVNDASDIYVSFSKWLEGEQPYKR